MACLEYNLVFLDDFKLVFIDFLRTNEHDHVELEIPSELKKQKAFTDRSLY